MRKSDTIKLELLKMFRFDRGFELCCTECIHYSDITAIKENCLVEVEVKISKSDFRREFQTTTQKSFNHWKEQKHEFYAEPSKAWSSYHIPNKFYFCVPVELAEWAKDYLKDKNAKYGLLAYDPELITTKSAKIRTIKSARNLHENAPKQAAFHQAAIRTTNELITLKQKYNEALKELETVKKGVLIAEGVA